MRTLERAPLRRHILAFGSYLTYIFVALIGYAVMNIRHTSGSSWALGDWLINYSGGFVRRGLLGEVILFAASYIHLSPIYLVMLLQLGCYGVILVTVWTLLRGSQWPIWLIALVVSPATLAFPIVDSQAGFRKEIIYFAAMSGLLLMLRRRTQKTWILSSYLSIVIIISTMSHEALVCFLPYYLAALTLGLRDFARAIKSFIVPAVLAVIVGYSMLVHPGNATTASEICESVQESVKRPTLDLCSGAINAIGDDRRIARERVIQIDCSAAVFRLYALLSLLSLLPIAIGAVDLWRNSKCREEILVVMAAFCLSLPASLILFVYADDWGRWIYIHIFSISLLLFFLECQRTDYLGLNATSVHKLTSLRLVLLALYAITWNLPHIPTYTFHSGYLGLYRHFEEFRSKPNH